MKVAWPFSPVAATLAQWAGHNNSPHPNAAIALGLLASCHTRFLNAVFHIIAQIGVRWLVTGENSTLNLIQIKLALCSIPLNGGNSAKCCL